MNRIVEVVGLALVGSLAGSMITLVLAPKAPASADSRAHATPERVVQTVKHVYEQLPPGSEQECDDDRVPAGTREKLTFMDPEMEMEMAVQAEQADWEERRRSHDAEPVDGQWAERMTAGIQEGLLKAELPLAGNATVDCRSVSCSIHLPWDSRADAKASVDSFDDVVDSSCSYIGTLPRLEEPLAEGEPYETELWVDCLDSRSAISTGPSERQEGL